LALRAAGVITNNKVWIFYMHVYFYVMYNTYAHCIYNYKGSYILTYFISLLGLNITDNNQVSGFCVPLENYLGF